MGIADASSAMWKIRLKDRPEVFPVSDGESILHAALGQGIDFPYGCQNGVCGDCKSKLVSGEIKRRPVSKVLLSDEEREHGYFLACKSFPLSDCVVEAGQNDIQPEQVTIDGKISAVVRVTHNVAIVRVRPRLPFVDFHPGQYAHVKFGDHPAREFSFANKQGDEELEFHIRRVKGGAVSTYVYDRTCVGDRIRITAPYGSAFFRPDQARNLILVASGTGLAPIKSILHAAVSENFGGSVTVYQAARDESSLYLVSEIEDLCRRLSHAELRHVVGRPDRPGVTSARLLTDCLDGDRRDLSDVTAFLCGSEDAVNACRETLVKKGLPQDKCHADAFVTRVAVEGLNAEAGGTVTTLTH